MKLLKRWLAFFVVVVLVISVAFNSRGPLRASHIGEENTTTNNTGELDGQTAEDTQQAEGDTGENTEQGEPAPDASTAEQPEVQEETPAEPEAPHQDEMELSQVMTGENGEAVCKVTANIPEGTFEANTADVTMEVTYAAADTTEQIKALMSKAVAEGNVLGNYFLYNVIFKVNGEQVEPGKEIKITFEQNNFQIKDTKKATTFYYNEANSVAGNAEAEIVKITQKSDKIEELQNAGESIDNIDDYDLSEISLKEDNLADKIMMEGRRSTIYGCYVEDQKPQEEAVDQNQENKEEEKTNKPESLKYEDDEVAITVTAEKEGIIPAGSTLQVVPIKKDEKDTKDQYKEVEEKLQEKAEKEEYDIAGFLAYDISFVDADGNKVEPKGEVKVVMDYKEAVLPEEVDEEKAKDTDVTVLHLEEDKKGEVKDVVDMGQNEKIENVETTDNKEVQKTEFTTESFSIFTITWTVNPRYAAITVHYVDEKGVGISGKQTEKVDGGTNNSDKVDLASYAGNKLPDGYEVVKYTKDSYNGQEIESKLNYKKSTKSIQYQAKGDPNWYTWLSFSKYSVTGDAYIVCKKIAEIAISDNITEDGSLTAKSSLSNIKSYTWFKGDSENGEYAEVKRVEYQGNVTNISKEGNKLYPTYDEGARKWYKVKATLQDGTTTEFSEPIQVAYYDELKNGSFETPQIATGNTSTHIQVSNNDYKKDGGVWQTTGTNNGADIELLRAVNGGSQKEKSSYAWNPSLSMDAVDGNQFAELNCEAAGALYQDVLTYEGQSLNWWLSHRARGVKQNSEIELDTMYLVIMPTSVAMTAGAGNSELDTQNKLQSYLNSIGVKIGAEYEAAGSEGLINNSKDGVYVYRITSNDQSWNSVNKVNDYIATASLTRFFFVAGHTASGNNTVGNFLDEVGFSQELPPVNDNEFSIEIQKKFEGLDNAGLEKLRNKIQFEISAINKNTGKALTEDEIKDLLGISSTTIKGTDMNVRVDGSLNYSIANRKISNNGVYDVTVTEKNAELSGYEMKTTAKTTVTHDGESEEPTNDSVIKSLKGKTSAKVEFTNSYNSVNYKNVNFTKVWDDNNNAFGTRPEILNVTLKASINVEEGGHAKTIVLDELEQTNVLTSVGGWKTSWKVPVYYDYNGVNVKINYTVVEGNIDSGYVYEPAHNGEAQKGDGKDYKKTDFSSVVTESETEPSLLGRSNNVLSVKSALSGVSTLSEEDDDEPTLGEPAHKKYIEYNANTAEYTLNLDVTGAKGEAKGADILFIIDTSGSMGSGYGSTYNNILPSLKKLLTDDNTGIIDRIFATEGNVNSVAYVSFAGKSETYKNGWYKTSDKKTLKNSINGLSASGGTNWTYAMRKASELLAQKSSSSNEKVVIFLSDGKPTYSMSGNSQTGNGSDTYSQYYTDAANEVTNSSSLSKAQMYSVYLTDGTKSGMQTFSSRLKNSELVNGTDLKAALDKILDKVIPTYENVSITDTLSEYVEFAESKPTITVTKRTSTGVVTTLASNQYTAEANGNTVKVNLLNGASLEDGATYTVSFKVKPSDKANETYAAGGYLHTGQPGTGITSAGQEGFYSNVKESTVVGYTVNGKSDSATYPMPVVQVTTHELTYTKEWIHPDTVSEPTVDVVLDVVYTDGTRGSVTLTKDNEYLFKETVPVTKKISSVTERKIEGYSPSYQITDDGTNAVVTNSYSKVTTSTIKVTKKWVGGTSRSPIDVSLYRSKGDGNAEKVDTLTLSEKNGWSDEWTNLKLSEGSGTDEVFYTYAVREENTPDNYKSNIVYKSEDGITHVIITNTYDPNCEDEDYYIANVLQTEKVTLQKTWDDDNDVLNMRPNKLQINVSDGNKTLAFYLNSNGWQKTVTLLKKLGGYTAEEVLNSDSYELVSSDVDKTNKETTFSFVNKIKTTGVTVSKEWNDGGIEKRPETISFTLQYKPIGSNEQWKDYETYSLTAENKIGDREWAMAINNLPISYEYQVIEVTTGGAYHSNVTNSGNDFTITNTLNWGVRKTSEQLADEDIKNLSGAEFELKRGNTVITTGTSGSDGMIIWVENKDVNLNELNGDYTIHETKAPTGYVLSSEDWTLTFANGLLTQLNGEEVFGDSENGVIVDITNTAIYNLPSTGGPGIFWYTVGGTLLMCLAGLLTLYKNKRKRGVGLSK